jgi:hypothetical protein
MIATVLVGTTLVVTFLAGLLTFPRKWRASCYSDLSLSDNCRARDHPTRIIGVRAVTRTGTSARPPRSARCQRSGPATSSRSTAGPAP